MRSAPGLAGAVLVLAACRAAPSVPPPRYELPASWTAPAAEGDAHDGRWWRALGGDELDGLVREALSNNRELAGAAARLEGALAQAEIAGALRAPTVGLGADGARSRQNFVGLPIPGGGVLTSTSTRFGVSLDVAWEADLWGRLAAGERAALADASAVAADLRGAALSLAAQTSRAWFALQEARAQVELAELTARSFQENADWIRARYERGLATPLELRLGLSNAADAEAALAVRREVRERVARQLEVLLGRYPAGELSAAPDLPDLPAPLPAGIPAALLERRPDLVAARARLAGRDARVQASEAALLPGLRLTASGGGVSQDLENLLEGDFSVWSLGAGITAPLFQGGRLRAEVDLAEARRAEAWLAWELAVLRACGEVESALAVESHLARRVAELERSAVAARAAEGLARRRYRSGVEPLFTLLDAQRRAALSESRWIEARRASLDNRIDLWLALGGGLDALAEDLPGPVARTETEEESE